MWAHLWAELRLSSFRPRRLPSPRMSCVRPCSGNEVECTRRLFSCQRSAVLHGLESSDFWSARCSRRYSWSYGPSSELDFSMSYPAAIEAVLRVEKGRRETIASKRAVDALSVRNRGLHVELEVHDVAVFHLVALSFLPELAGLSYFRLAAVGEQVLTVVCLRAYEASLKI